MNDVHSEYELLAEAGLFDASYDIATNPYLTEGGIDPFLHHIENGAFEMRNPSENFDPRCYAQQCLARGDFVSNPLLQYLKFDAVQSGSLSTNETNEFIFDH